MAVINRGFPKLGKQGNDDFYDYPSRLALRAFDKKNIDSLPKDKRALIKYLCKCVRKNQKEYWDFWDYDDRCEIKTLKQLYKISHSISVTRGNSLLSAFVSTVVSRGKEVKTRIVDNIKNIEITDAPANIDYDKNLFDSDFWEGKNKIEQDCVFSVEHKTRDKEPFSVCENCGGSGRMQCPYCGGTGREQYVDGTYASGVERIKTTACSVCNGSGKIPCEECNGTGKVDIYSPVYSVCKSVVEQITHIIECFSVLPDESVYSYNTNYYRDRYILMPRILLKHICDSETPALKKKNIDTIELDKTEDIEKELNSIGFGPQYKEMLKKLSVPKMDKNMSSIDIIERKEIHYILPVTIITFEYGSNKGRFVLYEKSGGTSINLIGLEGLSLFQRMFLRVKSFFK